MGTSLGGSVKLDGEKDFQNALRDINAGLKAFGAEMGKVAVSFEDNNSSIDAYAAKNEALSKGIEKQKEKIALTTEALGYMRQHYDENSAKVKKWEENLYTAETELLKLKKELDNNAKAMQETGKETSDLGGALQEARDKALTFGDVLKANLTSEAIIGGVKALVGAVKGLAESFVGTAKDTAAFADNVLTLASTTGVSTKALQEFMYMEELVDVSLDTMTSTMTKNIKSMASAAKGTGETAEAYRKLRVSIANADGALKDSEDVYWQVIDALGEMKEGTERDVLALQIFGKNAQELKPLIAQGSDGIAAFADEAHRMGAVLNDETLDSLGAFDDSLQRLDQASQVLQRSLGAALAPAFTEVTQSITSFTQDNQEGMQILASLIGGLVTTVVENMPLMVAGLGAVGFAMGAIGLVGFVNDATIAVKTIQGWELATKAQTAAQWLLNTAMAANPIGIITIAIAALVAGLIYLWNTNENFRAGVTAVWEDLQAKAEQVFGGLATFFTKTLPDAFNHTISWIKENWQGLALLITNPIAGGLKLLYDNNPGFKAWADDLIGQIKPRIENGLNAVKGAFSSLASGAKGKMTDMSNTVKSMVNASTEKVKSMVSGALDWGKDFVKGLIDGIVDKKNDMVETVKNIPKTIQEKFDELIENGKEWGKNLIQGFIDGIKEKYQALKDSVKNVIGVVADYMGFHSPAKEGEGRYITIWGENMVGDFMDGIGNAMPGLNALLAKAFQTPAFDAGAGYSVSGSTAWGNQMGDVGGYAEGDVYNMNFSIDVKSLDEYADAMAFLTRMKQTARKKRG